MDTHEAVRLTVLIPTRNEADNVLALLGRLARAVTETIDVVFVDDSDDGTPLVVGQAADIGFSRLNIRLIHRQLPERVGGLAGAVVRGLADCATPWVAVMDGDGQHPPELLPAMLGLAEYAQADLVVGSRYMPGGSNDGLNAFRKAVSVASTYAAKAVFPHRLRGISDPMSGFFLFRRSAVTAPLMPSGFKILLEIAAKHPQMVRREVPIVFEERLAGASKGTLKEGLRFLRLLASMRWRLRPNRVIRARSSSPVGLP